MIDKDDPLDFDSPRAISAFLAERSIALKKRWGQNFMVNRAAREKIVSLLHPQQDETVWEVGPGLGAMTALLAPRVGRLILFEIDWALIRHLESV
ncbi:MAG TPA: rRNA adenine N-6-methyltransferase family protein, partial [Spirochaetia bacterium]|nr:rRNA adenine N-6-methyltransferase family protein [Spirochaetia bacterium]